jgi:hypothetical protein
LKQGISLDTLLLACAAPVTVGQSINYLVQVAYQDTDANSVVLPYYNASNPSQAYSGPNNAGTTNFTTRKGACVISAKAGVSAATGSQTTPAPDSGYTGAFVVTVAYGQTTITAPNIAAYAGAPFIPSAGLIAGGLQGNVCNISAAGGTADAITGAYTPGIAALTNGMTLYVRAGSANATTTPTFTPASGTIAAKTIVKGAGASLVAGDIAGGGHWIELQYDLTLDKWVLLNPATGVTPASVASIQGAFKNLKASATGLSASISVTADEIAVENAANAYQTLRAVNLTIAGTASGVANGLDTGALAINTWYSLWAIWNGTTTAGLMSLSATAPTLPSGYTHKARVGWIRTDASGNKFPLPFVQNGRRVQYAPAAGTNLTGLPQMASGLVGTIGSALVAVGVGSFLPPTAAGISGNAYFSNGCSLQVGPSVSAAYPGGNNFLFSVPTSVTDYQPFDFILESTNIYWAANAASGAIYARGWEDNI